MTSRSLAAIAFVVVCLVLSGLVLRRQIAAHPIQTDTGQAPPPIDTPVSPDFLPEKVDTRTWHVVTGTRRQSVMASIQAQLDAFRAGDAPRAVRYQSQALRRQFATPEAFVAMIQRQYPEFGHCRAAQFGPVWADAKGQHADVAVTVQGQDGLSAQGLFLMVRENGLYRAAAVLGGQTQNRRAPDSAPRPN